MVSQSAMVITKFSFEHFFSFYQRMISTLPLKNLLKKVRKCHSLRLKTFLFDLQVVSKPFTKTFEKAEKRQFQRFRTFVFQLKIASKPFSKKLYITKFWLKQFLTLCQPFPKTTLKFDIQTFTKKLKNVNFKG